MKLSIQNIKQKNKLSIRNFINLLCFSDANDKTSSKETKSHCQLQKWFSVAFGRKKYDKVRYK